MVKLLIGVTGSVATIKLPILVNSFLQNDNFQVHSHIKLMFILIIYYL